MSLIIVETTVDQPLTPDILREAEARALPCLEARHAMWRYSLLSSDRRRMICTFDAPDAEAVRDSYRKADVSFSRIWAGELIQPQGHPPQRNEAMLNVIERTYSPPSEEDWKELSSKTSRCYTERGIEWIQSYLSFDRTRMICEFNAPDAESIREAQRKVKLPFDRVWSANVLRT